MSENTTPGQDDGQDVAAHIRIPHEAGEADDAARIGRTYPVDGEDDVEGHVRVQLDGEDDFLARRAVADEGEDDVEGHVRVQLDGEDDFLARRAVPDEGQDDVEAHRRV